MGSEQAERDSIRYEGAQSSLCLGWVGWDQRGMGPALGRVQSLHLSSPLQGLPNWFPSTCQPGIHTHGFRKAGQGARMQLEMARHFRIWGDKLEI